MKICFMCDLHLPFDKNALQYDILDWAITDIKKKEPDCVVYAGDVTCDGDIDIYCEFLDKMNGIGVPFVYIPGNSDLRNPEYAEKIKRMASPCKNDINATYVFALNDCDCTVSDEQLAALEEASESSIVFMHHPMCEHKDISREKLEMWRKSHRETMLFYGHLHLSFREGNDVSLQAMDPDKAIGENPCITYFDTETKELKKAYCFSTVPTDLYKYFGVSCFDEEREIEFAVKNNLECLELRPTCLKMDRERLLELIEKWRKTCGKNLSIHLPDIAYENGRVVADKQFDKYIELAVLTGADRFTQHVPVVAVKVTKEDKSALESICNFLADKFNAIEHDIVIGVENMHMTKKDTPDDNRRFGYIPEECILFTEKLAEKCRHKVGINFDIGHARNNAPYSRKYQISTWFSQVGKYIVGYHMHQVTVEDGRFENHMSITDIYGKLISYASFFRCWSEGKVNKAPVVFEMRPEGAYETTLNTFNKYRVHKRKGEI